MGDYLPNGAEFAKQVEQLLSCYVVAVEKDVSALIAIVNGEVQGRFAGKASRGKAAKFRYILEVLDEENPTKGEKKEVSASHFKMPETLLDPAIKHLMVKWYLCRASGEGHGKSILTYRLASGASFRLILRGERVL
jgi:hypothetical protein